MEREEFAENELVELLVNALDFSTEDRDGFMTTAEIAEKSGHGVGWVRDRLRSLKANGQLEFRRVSIVDLADRQTWVNAYRLKR